MNRRERREMFNNFKQVFAPDAQASCGHRVITWNITDSGANSTGYYDFHMNIEEHRLEQIEIMEKAANE